MHSSQNEKPILKGNDRARSVAIAALLFLFLLSGTPRVFAQLSVDKRYAQVDSAVLQFSRKGYQPQQLVKFVSENFKGDSLRVRAFYTWIATNIDYDKTLLDQFRLTAALIGNFRPGGRSQDADTVLSRRRAVCEGYCNLMNRFCSEVGITSVMVPGITRVPEGEVQEDMLHTWNAVRVHGQWQLLDITWAGGYVDHRDIYIKRFSGRFFFSPPKQFAHTHWPLDAMWQLLERPVTKTEFYNGERKNTGNLVSYNDSIEAYLKLPPADREYADLLHYHRNDPQNTIYTQGCDHYVYNRSATFFNLAMLYFEDYMAYARKLQGKEIGMKEVKKCMRLLQDPKRNLEQGLKFAEGKIFFHEETKTQFDQMVQKSAKLLIQLNGYMGEYRKMEAALK